MSIIQRAHSPTGSGVFVGPLTETKQQQQKIEKAFNRLGNCFLLNNNKRRRRRRSYTQDFNCVCVFV